MAIKITKLEKTGIVKTKNKILTPLYGEIPIISKIDSSKYTYFDTIDKYDLFISNNTDDTVAIKQESNKIQTNEEYIEQNYKDDYADDYSNDIHINDTLNHIKSNYNIDKLNWIEKDNAIIIKGSKDILINILEYYKDSNDWVLSFITPELLFMETAYSDINNEKLTEDNNSEFDEILDKVDDSTLRDLVKKGGGDPSKVTNKDELKGMVKGMAADPNKKPLGTI